MIENNVNKNFQEVFKKYTEFRDKDKSNYLFFNYTQYFWNIENKVIILKEILELIEYRVEEVQG